VPTVESQPSPLLPWVRPLAVAMWVGAVLARTQSTGAGQELHTPGAQVFFDALAFCALSLSCVEVWLAKPRWLRLGLPLGACVAVAILLLAEGAAAPDPDLGWRTAVSWCAAAALGLSAALLSAHGPEARWLGAVLIASVALGACSGLYQYFVEFPELQRQLEAEGIPELALYEADFQQGLKERIYATAATGPWLLPNMLAAAVAMVFPLGVVFAISQRRWRRGAAVGVCVLLVAALLATKSKGGILAWAASLGAFALLYPRWRHLRPRLLAGVGAIGAGVALVGGGLFLRARETHGVGLSLTVRLEYWQSGWAMWTDAPWLGHGLNAFRALYPAYKLPSAEETKHAHNGVVQLLVEVGLIGVLILAAGAALWAWRAARRAPPGELTQGSGPRGAVVGGLFVGALALLAGGDALSLSLEFPLTLLGIGALAWALAEGEAIPAERWRAGVAAGIVGFLADSLTNFGLHQAGCLVTVLVLAGLTRAGGAALEEGEPAPSEPPAWLGATAAGLASVVALACVFGAQPLLLADSAREEARALHMQGAEHAAAGRSTLARESLREAREAYDAAIEADPDFVDGYRERASVCRALGDLPAAVADLERAVELVPIAAAPHNELGHALLESGDEARALAAFDAALERYPGHPQFLLDAAEARAASRDPVVNASAADYAQRALAASEATRLQLRKLTANQRARAEALLEE